MSDITVTSQEARDIVSALRSGLVPRSGLHHFAVGMDALMGAIGEEMGFVGGSPPRGLAKWMRGAYGSGKTFATRYLCAQARALGFATSEVQISINDTPLHQLETVYRRLMERLTTAADGQGAFQAIVDGWIFQLGEEVQRIRGLSEDDPGFSDAVEARLEDRLAELSASNPAYAQVLRGYHRALQAGEFGNAQGLLGWLAGQPHIGREVTATAGVRGQVDGAAALAFLRGLLLLLRQSGHAGLVVVLDEVETIQRMQSNTREKALNVLRQLVDMLANEELPGLYLVVTGTPDFFEGYRGVKGLPPLYQRVQTSFGPDARFDNLRAPQVRLPAFDAARLLIVGKRIRDLFPAKHADRKSKVSDAFVTALVEHVTSAFGGRVEVGPRLFLRELVDVLDRVDQHAEFDPAAHYKLTIDESALTPVELAAMHGAEVPEDDVVSAEASQPPAGIAGRRLDG